MGTFLFDEVIFGPVRSRRLGNSLGINLLPTESKYCNYNCVYCECGWTKNDKAIEFPSVEEIEILLKARLIKARDAGEKIDVITFAGNGEPTLHPHFREIIDIAKKLSQILNPAPKIAVLSNATMLHNSNVVEGLKQSHMPILKIDSAVESTYQKINLPKGNKKIEKLIDQIKQFNGNFILQIMFFKGNGIDNTTADELGALLKAANETKPKQIMIYTIARDTPAVDLERISPEQMKEIAQYFEKEGFKVHVSV